MEVRWDGQHLLIKSWSREGLTWPIDLIRPHIATSPATRATIRSEDGVGLSVSAISGETISMRSSRNEWVSK